MTIHGKTPGSGFVLYFFFVSISLAGFCSGVTIIPQGQYIRDMNETLVSLEGNFELGFFSPQNSSLRYVGIWYHKIEEKEIVWVANRETPLYDRNGVLRVGEDGNLVVLDVDGYGVWSSNISVSSGKTAATLLDSGNLVLSSIDSLGDISKALWQSFDHPTDTYLPGMRVRVNAAMGESRVFTSWKSANDPGLGNFTVGIDPNGAPQIVIWDKGRRRWRSGQWNGVIFTGVPEMSVLTSYLFGFKLSPPEADGSMFFSYLPSNASVLLRFHVDWTGKEQKLKWDGDKKVWDVVLSQPANECELYNYCGNFGICNTVKFGKCSCLSGFEPTSADEWSRGNWSGGCVRREKLQCERNVNGEPGKRESDGFKEFRCVKLPDFGNIVPSADPQACRSKCLEDCSCNAYADIMGIGCMIWTGPLVDIQEFDDGGNLLFLRLAHSELGGRRTFSMVAIIVVAVVGTCFFISCVWKLWGFKSRRQAMSGFSSFSDLKDSEIPMFDVSKSREFSDDLSRSAELLLDGKQVSGSELLFFNYRFVAAATDNFSEVNKLGRGGFGTVYKGYFPGGEEIAVKRLSGRSGQGLEEFKNEIVLIAKLQHRNLVRLLGCSIHEEEKLLIYEYMPNRSLDCFLFDRTKQAWLDWRKRFTIIEGIARGLLYLHRDSRLRIIHRDLKSSNILLDADMNPKISDFGMARIFGSNQHEANTVRVVGTYGYMSPEYAMEGLFSVKSDVYSFGILLLEIISGKRNAGFSLSEHTSLIAYAWDLWTEDKVMELVDPSIRDTCSRNEVLKCVHIGLLCVQDSAGNRPNIHSVVLMLESENPEISMPSQPTFTFGSKGFGDDEIFVNHHDSVASNQLTISMIVGR